MTPPPIPAAEAIRGLVEALRALGDAVDRGDSYRVLASRLAQCRAALDAFERRAPLAYCGFLVEAVNDALVCEGISLATRERLTPAILDAIDSALFGPAAKEGSR